MVEVLSNVSNAQLNRLTRRRDSLSEGLERKSLYLVLLEVLPGEAFVHKNVMTT
jgi:hypothetical protein